MAVRALTSERGQASIALVASLPLLALAAAFLLQVAVLGHTAWSAANAARAVARAESIGADPEAAARGVLPGGLLKPAERPQVRVDSGTATVRIEAQRLPAVRSLVPPLRVGASAALVPEAGPDGG